MEPKQTVSRRLDWVDPQRFADMVGSEPFAWLMERVRHELDRERATCESSEDAQEVARAQGAVKALRMTLGLPARLSEEIKVRRKGESN